jgi:flagellar motor switch/type III secretory pathway protein FliN
MSEERSLQVTTPDVALSLAQHGVATASSMGRIELHAEWDLLARIPMRLTAGVPLPRFKVKDLVELAEGSVIESVWTSGADVPLKCGDVQLGWAEFEVVEQRLAVRITRLA